jgi:hypothetical protein
MTKGALHPLRSQSYRQVWLSAIAVPLAVLVVGLGLRLIFHTWPQFDMSGVVGIVGYIALIGGRQSLALRRRRRALSWSTDRSEVRAPAHRGLLTDSNPDSNAYGQERSQARNRLAFAQEQVQRAGTLLRLKAEGWRFDPPLTTVIGTLGSPLTCDDASRLCG